MDASRYVIYSVACHVTYAREVRQSPPAFLNFPFEFLQLRPLKTAREQHTYCEFLFSDHDPLSPPPVPPGKKKQAEKIALDAKMFASIHYLHISLILSLQMEVCKMRPPKTVFRKRTV